ncbi:DUF1345 domain-containing protein [Flavisphingomonas formosensis]|uniref:DUF1345 domain-containing protein n=1 Tax=Flavisphingomonas formosensis TaxID=861534 RepID=UPI0012F83E5A|nr:DUF1345 domain-containing protein [Sphingomonas formosensis]
MPNLSLAISSTIAPPRFLVFGGLLIAGIPIASRLGLQHGLLLSFDVAAGVFLLSLLPLLRSRTADDMRRRSKENDANRALLLGITGAVMTVILVAVAAELSQKQQTDGYAIALIVSTLLIAWLFSNSVYALHYAHIFYLENPEGEADCGGLDFPGTKEPDYWDFVYFAFTLGMTFQTSDVDMTQGHMRRVATFHCLAAFIFNIGILAFSINVLGGS